MSKPTVLIIEDDPDGLRSVSDAIEDAGIEVVATATAEAGLQAFRSRTVDAVISDLVLPDQDGIAVLRQIQQMDAQTPVMIMTAYGSVESSVEAIKAGAYDYITKPLDLDDLQSKIKRAVETRRLRSEVASLRQTLRGRCGVRSILGQSVVVQELLRQIQALADTNATVLVTGESGTGKELVARALHYDGRRSDGPFVAVNCGAFAETLLESELFGHEKGAFTGAVSRHSGAFERADGGTLFLDEVGDAPKSVQVKLLRALEEREIIRIGGQESFKVDVRVISASNRDLGDLVAAGDFREDLLYRLKVITLDVPPLRERKEDLRSLADHFIAAAAEEHGRHISQANDSFYDALRAYDWPGNIRELRNTVEAAVVMTTEAALSSADVQVGNQRRGEPAEPPELVIPQDMSMEEIEKQALIQHLERFQGNRTLAADALGLSRRTVQRKIKELNLPY